MLGKTAVGRVQFGLKRIVEGLELDGVVVEELVDLGQVVSGVRGNLCWSLSRRRNLLMLFRRIDFLMLLQWERSGKGRLVTNDNLRCFWIFDHLTRLLIERIGMLML